MHAHNHAHTHTHTHTHTRHPSPLPRCTQSVPGSRHHQAKASCCQGRTQQSLLSAPPQSNSWPWMAWKTWGPGSSLHFLCDQSGNEKKIASYSGTVGRQAVTVTSSMADLGHLYHSIFRTPYLGVCITISVFKDFKVLHQILFSFFFCCCLSSFLFLQIFRDLQGLGKGLSKPDGFHSFKHSERWYKPWRNACNTIPYS